MSAKKKPRKRKSGKRAVYTLDGKIVNIRRFIADNADDFEPSDVTALERLMVGESITYGGGAFAVFVLKRIR